MRRFLAAAFVGVTALAGLAAPSAGAMTAQAGSVRIEFVRYDPAGSDTGTNAHVNKEVVVIHNGTSKAKQLAGWKLRDTAGHVYRFPATKVRSHHSVTVHTGKGNNNPGDRFWDQGFYVWNNTGDKAILRNKAGSLVDTCKWGDGDGTTGC
jgi:hypothetical protein